MQYCNAGLYWLLRLDRRPAAEDYLLCDTGTLALRVHVVMPGRRARAAKSDLYLCPCVSIDHFVYAAHLPVGAVC